MNDNIVEIPQDNVSSAAEEEDGWQTVTLSAEDIIDLPRETALKVIEYILEQWHDACHEEEESDYPEDANLEMGFDPYLGCYTEDC